MSTRTLAAQRLTLAYDDSNTIVVDLTVQIPHDHITAIIGPNGCGKSTLLRGLARLLRPCSGTVLLDGVDIARLPATQLAKRMGMLPQQPIAPGGVTVADLVGRGRHPHQRWFRQWSRADEAALTEALAATGLSELADRPVDELSGGQRQRVWIALALAQDPQIMLLDEPTTFLDLAHQVDVLDLLRELNISRRRTIVLVLHDLNLATRYADYLIAMKSGRIYAEGPPSEVVHPDIVRDVFGLDCEVIDDPLTGTPLVLPRSRSVSLRTVA